VTSVRPPPWFVFSFFLFVFSAMLTGVESFTLAAPLRCNRVEFLRCGDGSNTTRTLAVWTNTRLERKCIAGVLRNFRVFFPDYGLLITFCRLPFMLAYHHGLAISPWYRLVFGILVIFSECNLLCSSVFQFVHFILFYFVCVFVLFLFLY